MKIKVISLVCIISLLFQMFVFDIPVFAVENIVPVPGYSELKEMDEDIKNGDNRTLQDIWNTLQPIGSAIGVVMNPIQTIEYIRDIVDPVVESLPDYPTNGTETEKANYISSYLIDNTTINDNDKTYSLNQNSKSLVNAIVNNYINETGFRYVYTYNIVNYATLFSSGEKYVATRDFISDLQADNIMYVYNNTYPYGWSVDMSNSAFVRLSEQQDDYTVQVYDLTSWEMVPGDKYQYSDDAYNLVQVAENGMLQANVKKDSHSITSMPNWGYYSSGRNNVYKMYMSLADLKADSVGQAPYYINNSVYNDWSTSTGDYTVNTDNSNHATYGNITSYINSFNTENGHNPSDTDIFKWIENYDPTVNPIPTPNPDNPSGSGSFVNNNNPVFNNNPNININLLPGDGTVSGNGTGGSSGIGNIFGFLSDIGKFLGDLIKNLGQALVDVIKGIGDLFNSIITDLPTVFFDFLGAVFNWLPEEWVRLMGLSFACMLIVGVIKIFRR